MGVVLGISWCSVLIASNGQNKKSLNVVFLILIGHQADETQSQLYAALAHHQHSAEFIIQNKFKIQPSFCWLILDLVTAQTSHHFSTYDHICWLLDVCTIITK